jgi:L-ribulokinase
MPPVTGDAYLLGVDFGTLSARAVVVRALDGTVAGAASHDYRNGVIDERLPASGEPLPPSWALQDPDDWLDAIWTAVPAAIAEAGIDPDLVVGIGTDFTASTPLPVTRDGTPLCKIPSYSARPHAYPKLWKHHAAQQQADRVTSTAAARGESWLARYGGRISSEWARGACRCSRRPAPSGAADRWIEAAD